jgi:hypothetical protein
MGVGLRIPHTNNEGGFWLRMVVKMEISGEAISVEIIDGKTVRGISSDYSVRDLAKIQEAIFECARDTLCNPVRSARGIGRIGFIDEV